MLSAAQKAMAAAGKMQSAAQKAITAAPVCLNGYPLAAIAPYFDWDDFFRRLDMGRKNAAVKNEYAAVKNEYAAAKNEKAADKNEYAAAKNEYEKARDALRQDAGALLDDIVTRNRIVLRGVVRFLPALSHNETITVYEPAAAAAGSAAAVPADAAGQLLPAAAPADAAGQLLPAAAPADAAGQLLPAAAPADAARQLLPAAGREAGRFTFPRSVRDRAGLPNPCLADFILPEEEAGGRFDTLGFFALSAGFGVEALKKEGDCYRAILAASIADGLAEAWSAETQSRLAGSGIRPAFGYPCCPLHEDKRLAFKLLNAEALCGLRLTETAMIEPAASVCGMYFLNPRSFYFAV